MKKRICSIVAALALAASAGAQAATPAMVKEYYVKAAFIYTFTKFIAWPSPYSLREVSNVDICVTDDTTLTQASAVFREASTKALSYRVKIIKPTNEAVKGCHILFLGEEDTNQAAVYLKLASAAPVLTVSEIKNFSASGGMVEFIKEEKKVKLVINVAAARKAGLKIDAQLLEIAEKVIR